MKTIKTLLIAAIFLALAGALVVVSGAYNVAANQPHTDPVYNLLELARNRSISVRAESILVPQDLSDVSRIKRGAGNYDAMCVGCHLKPGLANTELRKGMYPQPPDLTDHEHEDPAESFWIIKHGIKMTGMSAWSAGGVDDETIWDIVALLQAMPDMTADEYTQLVASSEGHSHAGADDHGHGGNMGGRAHSDSAHDHTPATASGTNHHGHHSDPMPMAIESDTQPSGMGTNSSEDMPGIKHPHDDNTSPSKPSADGHHHDDKGSKPHAH